MRALRGIGSNHRGSEHDDVWDRVVPSGHLEGERAHYPMRTERSGVRNPRFNTVR